MKKDSYKQILRTALAMFLGGDKSQRWAYKRLPVSSALNAPSRWGTTQPGWRKEQSQRRHKEIARRQRRNA